LAKKKQKKKVRVAFRKNRQVRARANDLTREVHETDADDVEHASGERLSGKGELTRYRTVIGVEQQAGDGGEFLIDVDESKCLRGRVIRAHGLNCLVQAEDGRRFECTVRRVVRTLARDERNAVVAGDVVLFQPAAEDQGVIERVNPRHGILARGSQRRAHVIVANVDQVLIVASAADPPLKTNLIDRFLISAEKGGVGAVICINKADLVDPAELQPVAGLYARLGYDVVITSVQNATGIARLRSLLMNRQTVLSGQSGVGKSSLLNAVQPKLALETAAVSRDSGKGRHTTRSAVLLELHGQVSQQSSKESGALPSRDDGPTSSAVTSDSTVGGWVVDTPGIRQLELWDVIPEEVEGYFVEFRPFVTYCKFPNCSHTHEDGCGIKSAVARDLISEARYESYCRIVAGDPVV
jgi:ribosome biogenesis GTPase / thiamine phosphate phosphatase